ncbi:hypothetical protein DPMN_058300 [Dreissena polymorpha]|uniref:P2X purinoreceptor 7 intracellular domain-containing protein n=1 Tax=Dreissena polymorpha TaxID=45954 RepID=A0A9D4C1W9_DREPO|nr:hypothetical protein DPMN_058300 [Dreissena polymorpha]
MTLSVLDRMTLYSQQQYRQDVFSFNAETLDDVNKSFRHAAYRQFTILMHGKLTAGDRRTVPACCVKLIREKFPSPSGQFTGFVPGEGPVF